MTFKNAAIRILAMCAGAITLSGLLAANWPQWRGPSRDGISGESGLLTQWPAEGPKLLWQVNKIGDGYSTPAVVGDRLYLISNKGLDNEFIQALDTADGHQIWETRLGKVGNPDQQPSYPAARSTPTVDGDFIYALGSDGDLACLEAATGNMVWKKNVRADFAGKPGEWAYSESPLVDGEVVVCTPGGKEATFVALNKKTGDVIWKGAVPEGDEAGYASIVPTEVDGQKQYVQFLGKGLVGIDAATGKFLWRYDRTGKSPANIPTPVTHEDFVYSGGSRSGSALVQIKKSGDDFDAKEIYYDMKLPNVIGGSVHVGDYLYGTTRSEMICANFKTGEVKWSEQRGIAPASICYADGRLYLHSEKGDVALIEATPDGFHELGKFTPPNQPDRGTSKAWAYPVVANGRLYIQDMGSLWCYDVKGPAKSQ